jgi:hypothetical protein
VLRPTAFPAVSASSLLLSVNLSATLYLTISIKWFTGETIMPKQFKHGLLIAFSLLAAFPVQLTLAQNQPPAAQADPDVDTRRGITTRPNERSRILTNMRQYLVGLQAMTDALARDDMKAAAQAARSMGSINLYEVRLAFPNRAAVEFRELAFEVHRDFDAVANDAESKKDPKLMLSQLAAIMKKCAHCHDTYRLTDKVH